MVSRGMDPALRAALDRLSSLCYRQHTCCFCGGDEYGLDDEGKEGGMYHKTGCPWLTVNDYCERTGNGA
jgi:hypothetical protein